MSSSSSAFQSSDCSLPECDNRVSELLVGNEPCSYLVVCDVLEAANSSGDLWTKLLDLSRSLRIPEERIRLIPQWLLLETKTHHSVLYEILETWRGKESSGAKLSSLIHVLELRGLQEGADALRQHFNVCNSVDHNISSDKYSKVNFQGSLVPICDILNGIPMELVQNLTKKFLHDTQNSLPLVSNTIPPPLKYYIPRRLKTRSHLVPALFEKSYTDVFVLRYIQLHELAAVAKKQGTDFSSNQLDTLTVQFILLEYEQDFDKICKISTAPVHLIDHNNGQFTWFKSYGDISNLQMNLSDKQDKLNEDEYTHFFLQSSTPICISDTPGMGKTVLLANIAHKLRQCYPERLVVFIVLREFIQKIPSISQADNKYFLIGIIAEHVSETELGKEIIKLLLNSESKVVELMFDGFDEVLDNQIDKTKVVLKNISHWSSVRMYVSTRPHMSEELENTVGVLGHNILPFGQNEQISCLTKYWEQQNQTLDTMRLEKFAEKCLQKLNETMNDFECIIAGIPLQCSLLAEVYQDEAIKYSQPETRLADIDLGVVIRITSIFALYEKLMELKFGKIVENTDESRWKWLTRLPAQNKVGFLINVHIYEALKLVFPNEAQTFRRHLVWLRNAHPRKLYLIGILEKKGVNKDVPRFVHRTFAEYFLGLFFAHMLTMDPDYGSQIFCRKKFLDFFFKSALCTTKSTERLLTKSKIGSCEAIQSAHFQNPVICYFINSHLKNCAFRTHRQTAWTDDHEKLCSLISACIMHDFSRIYNQTVEVKAHQKMLQHKSSQVINLKCLAAKYSSLELFKMVDQWKESKTYRYYIKSTFPDFVITPLQVAVERGHFAITNNILNSIGKEEIAGIKYVIHCCVAGSIKDGPKTLSEKIQILRLLSERNKKWINETLPDRTTPLLTFNLHVNLIQTLISCGANLNAKTVDGENLLHVCAKHGSHDSLLYILSSPEFLNIKVNTVNRAGLTPLMLGMKIGKGLNLTIVKMMEEKGIIFTPDLASEGLKHLICNTNILEWEIDNDFVQVADYCMHKGGVVKCEDGKSPWALEALQRSMLNIAKITTSSDILLKELEKREIISEDIFKTCLENPKELYNELSTNEFRSFEALCLSLVSCNQIQPFIQLKQCLQTDEQEMKFVTPPNGIKEFLSAKNQNVIILLTLDWELSHMRLQNTIDPVIPIITQEDLKRRLPSSRLLLFKCSTATVTLVKELDLLQTKIVCLCSRVLGELGSYVVVKDDFAWEDFSAEFKQRLKLNMQIKVLSKHSDKWEPHRLVDFIRDFSMLKNYLLVSFMRNNKPNLVKSRLVKKMGTDIFLKTEIFHYFLQDKLVFQGIAYKKLKQLAKFGQKVGLFNDDINEIDYLLVDNEAQFEPICRKTRSSVHLITYKDDRFKLVKSKGNQDELLMFLEDKFYDFFPGCNCDKFINDLRIHITFEHYTKEVTSICIPVAHLARPLDHAILGQVDSNEIFELEKLPRNFSLQNISILCDTSQNSEFSNDDNVQSNAKIITELVTKLILSRSFDANSHHQLQNIAVSTLFPKLSHATLIPEIEKYLDTGLVKNETCKFVFVHDTIAWFFIAGLVLANETVTFVDLFELRDEVFNHNFESYDLSMQVGIGKFDEVSCTKKISSYAFRNIRLFNFIETLLSQKKNVTAFKLCLQNTLTQEILERWIHACIHANCFHIIQILLSFDLEPFSEPDEVLLLTTKFANVHIIKLVVEKFIKKTGIHTEGMKSENKNEELFILILRVAAIRGSYSVMHYLLNNHKFQALLHHSDGNDLLHFCVMNTYGMNHNQITGRKKIIDFMLQINPLLVRGNDQYKQTALLVYRIHIDLILHLLKHGVYINVANKRFENILHLCPEYLNAIEYDKFIQYIYKQKFLDLLLSQDVNKCTPLHRAVQHLELLSSTLQVFKSVNADFNCVDVYGDPVLFYAVKGHRSAFLLENLIRHGADVNKKGYRYRTVLHLAALLSNLTAVKYFISIGCDTNAKQNKHTPLHSAVLWNSSRYREAVVKVLVENKAEVNAKNNIGQTPLSIAIRQNKEGRTDDSVVEYLKMTGGY